MNWNSTTQGLRSSISKVIPSISLCIRVTQRKIYKYPRLLTPWESLVDGNKIPEPAEMAVCVLSVCATIQHKHIFMQKLKKKKSQVLDHIICGLKASSGFSWQRERNLAAWLARLPSVISFSPRCSLCSVMLVDFPLLKSAKVIQVKSLCARPSVCSECHPSSSSAWGRGLPHKSRG